MRCTHTGGGSPCLYCLGEGRYRCDHQKDRRGCRTCQDDRAGRCEHGSDPVFCYRCKAKGRAQEPCSHGGNPNLCMVCNPVPKCKHNMDRRSCTECFKEKNQWI